MNQVAKGDMKVIPVTMTKIVGKGYTRHTPVLLRVGAAGREKRQGHQNSRITIEKRNLTETVGVRKLEGETETGGKTVEREITLRGTVREIVGTEITLTDWTGIALTDMTEIALTDTTEIALTDTTEIALTDMMLEIVTAGIEDTESGNTMIGKGDTEETDVSPVTEITGGEKKTMAGGGKRGEERMNGGVAETMIEDQMRMRKRKTYQAGISFT